MSLPEKCHIRLNSAEHRIGSEVKSDGGGREIIHKQLQDIVGATEVAGRSHAHNAVLIDLLDRAVHVPY